MRIIIIITTLSNLHVAKSIRDLNLSDYEAKYFVSRIAALEVDALQDINAHIGLVKSTAELDQLVSRCEAKQSTSSYNWKAALTERTVPPVWFQIVAYVVSLTASGLAFYNFWQESM